MDANVPTSGSSAPRVPAGRHRRGNALVPVGLAAAVAAIAVGVMAARGTSDGGGSTSASASVTGPIHNGDTVAASGKVRVSPDGTVEFCPDTISDLVGHGPGWVDTSCERGIPLASVEIAKLTDVRKSKDGYLIGQAHLEGVWRDRTITVTQQGPPKPPIFDRGDERPPCSAPPGGWQKGLRNESALNELRTYVAAHPDEYSGFWVTYPLLGPSAVVDPTAGPSMEQLSVEVITVGSVGDLAADQQVLASVYSGNLCLTRAPHSAADLQQARAVFLPHMGQLGINSIGTGFGSQQWNTFVVSVGVDYIDDTIWQLMQEAGPDLLDVQPTLVKVSVKR